jgi:AcrR family transcriptional regulator
MIWGVVAPEPPRLDRRKRKTRAALRQALLGLIAAKPYDAIKIEDITDAADVARATFYTHYSDKAALLREVCSELIGDLTERAAAAAPQNTPAYAGAATVEIFREAGEHRDLCRLVLRGEGGVALRTEMIDALRDALAGVLTGFAQHLGREPRVPLSGAATGFVGALLLTIERWLAGELEGKPEEIAAVFVRNQVGGLEWALGFDPGELIYRPQPG